MIVLDASVVVKWFVPEHGSAEAERLLTDPRKLFAPDLIRVEVAAALTRKVRLGEAPEPQIREHCANWPRMLAQGIVTLTPAEHDYPEAVALALQLKHPMQDCLYLALAQRLQAPLVTADPKFIEKVASIYPAVRPLTPTAPRKKRQ
ncbi:MAG: type II toxin-antitoxin system VapC family toxin [Gemmataceae bacterium]|nr:type II toxin-antitoxin system VapC family toxin [Gemmataceae bacterium]